MAFRITRGLSTSGPCEMPLHTHCFSHTGFGSSSHAYGSPAGGDLCPWFLPCRTNFFSNLHAANYNMFFSNPSNSVSAPVYNIWHPLLPFVKAHQSINSLLTVSSLDHNLLEGRHQVTLPGGHQTHDRSLR